MKEITRIHLAKVAYDIEVEAKKDIQKYITALERYADDAELLDDIEIRITELLAERGVAAGGVIAKDDVAAVRVRLGEPSDFAPEGDIVVGRDVDDQTRKLYRDMDSAILGGVLAGVARFFKIDPIWTRLIFIILLFPSFGTAVIVYLVMWLIVPPAKTAAEKLQMRGRAVTLDAIKEISENETVRQTARVMQDVVRLGVAIVTLVGAIGTLVATVWITFGLTFGTTDSSPLAAWRPFETWWIALALGLFTLAGLLLSTLGFILADAAFRKKWSRRIGISVVTIITAGILSFVGGVSTVWYGSWQENVQLNNLRKTSYVTLPATFKHVKSLEITGGSEPYGAMIVEYIVSDRPRYEFDALPGITPQVKIGDDGVSATVSIKLTNEQTRWYWASGQPSLKIYGPALETIVAKNNATHYYNDDVQNELTINGESGQFSLAGVYKTVRVTSKDVADVALGSATIENLVVKLEGGHVAAGVVRTLAVEAPDVCPARESYGEKSRVEVQAISSDQLTLNGQEQAAKFVNTNCSLVSVGLKDYDYDKDDE